MEVNYQIDVGHKTKTQSSEVYSALHPGFLAKRCNRTLETCREHIGSTPTLWAKTKLERPRPTIQLSPMRRGPRWLQPSTLQRHRTCRLLHPRTTQRTILGSPSGKPHFFRIPIPPRPNTLHHPQTKPGPLGFWPRHTLYIQYAKRWNPRHTTKPAIQWKILPCLGVHESSLETYRPPRWRHRQSRLNFPANLPPTQTSPRTSSRTIHHWWFYKTPNTTPFSCVG